MSPSKRKKKINTRRSFVAELNEEALFLDPPSTFDDAIVGRTCGASCVAIYDYDAVKQCLINHDKMDEQSAIDHIEYNILPHCGIENFPIVVKTYEEPFPFPSEG